MRNCGGRAEGASCGCLEALLDSYRRLADIFRELLSGPSLGGLLEEIAAALADLVPHEALTIYRLDDGGGALVPVLARDKWADEIMKTRVRFGEGITGWAALHEQAVWTNQAQLDPRVKTVPGTPEDEPEALICIPLLAGGRVRGALNVYRLGAEAAFSEEDFELARRFGDAAALALAHAEMRRRLEEEARTDVLTGLRNRRAFCEQLEVELARSARSGEPLALLLVDIDDFKQVSDRFGHGLGDQALIGLARVLASVVRAGDVVCRLGGDEFALVLPGADEASARLVGERARTRLAALAVHGVGTIAASVGIACAGKASTANELVERADAALLSVKRAGKDDLRVA